MPDRFLNVVFTEKGATRVTKAMSDVERSARKTASTTETSANKVNTAFAKASGGGIKGAIGGLSALGGGAAFAATAGLTAVAAGIQSVVQEAREQEKATRLTEAVLKSTGGAAGVTARQVEDLASKLSTMSGTEDDVIQSGENLLLTFTSIRNEAGKGNDIFNQATATALDMAAAFGQDLQPSIIRVGKALQDPVGGLQALRKVGVNVTDLTDRVHKLVEQGDRLGAQKAILQELQTEFGGAAAAAADPFDKFNVAIKDFKQQLGIGIIPLLTDFVDLLTAASKIRIPDIHIPGFDGGKKTADEMDRTAESAVKMGKALDFSDLKTNPFEAVANSAKRFLTAGPIGLLRMKRDNDAAKKATEEFDAAQKQLNKDMAAGNYGKIAADNKRVQAAYRALHPELFAASKGLRDNKRDADAASFAYLGLAASVDTVGEAIAGINAKAFAGFNLGIAAEKSTLSFHDAVAALHEVDDANAASTGSTQTAAAAAVDRASKGSSLRDALQGVKDADQDAKTAQRELIAARKSYEQVLNGVARGTLAAVQAEEAYTQAQDNAKSSVLDLRDARRQLADALEAQKVAQREASENLGSASRSRTSARLDVGEAKLNLQDAVEGGDPDEIARAQIALGDAEQRLRDATEAVAQARKDKAAAGKQNSKEDDAVKRAQIALTEAQVNNKQATREQDEALRLLNGTLHGFPASSKEAQDALNSFRDAQRNAREATDATKDATNELFRAQADLAGKLDAVGGSATSAGKKMTSLASKFLDVKSAALDMAESVSAKVAAATGSVGRGILAEIQALRDAVSAEPLLAGAFDSVLKELERRFAVEAQRHYIPGHEGHRVKGTGIVRRASGGPVPGTDVSGIPILAHPGEYVVRKKAVEKYGLHTMSALNAGALPQFASGGQVPGRDGSVVPHHALANSRPATAPAFVYQQNAPIYGVNDFHAEIVKALQEYSRRNGFVPNVRIGS